MPNSDRGKLTIVRKFKTRVVQIVRCEHIGANYVNLHAKFQNGARVSILKSVVIYEPVRENIDMCEGHHVAHGCGVRGVDIDSETYTGFDLER